MRFGGEEFHFRVAKNLKQDKELIEAGFEYETDMQFGEMTYKLFRKRKPWHPS